MKATIERATLLRCLSHVQSVVERRNTIPILSNVLIEARRRQFAQGHGNRPRSAGDRAYGSQCRQCRGDHRSRRTCCSISHASCPKVRRSASKRRKTAWRSRRGAAASLPTLLRDDFPVIVEGDLPTSFELPAKTFADLIDRTRFAISTEETRYYLNGIFFHVSDDNEPVLQGGRNRRSPARAFHAAAA